MKEKSIRFVHEMINDETGELAASTELVGVHIDTAARRSTPFPAEVVARGRELAA
jgi:acyl-CoA thioester hydrolase